MKHTLINISEMSDSKEVYGQRPNPFIAAFIYSILALLLIAVLYSCFGKIEIVSTASGVVRPNEDVSTVSSLISGRLTGVFYTDGQIVQMGDPMLTLDTSESQISLNSQISMKEEYEKKISMLDRFLDGIEAETNPFSPNEGSEEYLYYIQFRDYELTRKDSKEKFDYDAGGATANISSTNQRISDIENRIAGLNAYKASVQTGSNQAALFPEYEHMFLLYGATVNAMDAEYKSQQEKIILDQAIESNQYYLNYYGELISDYEFLVSSIEEERSQFPSGHDSLCVLLWNDYVANLDEYRRKYDAAVNAYEQSLNDSNHSAYSEELLAYDRAMLEGYQYFWKSVESDSDVFIDGRESISYRSLYEEYKVQYDNLIEVAQKLQEQYLHLSNDPSSTENDIGIAFEEKTTAEDACASYKSNTLNTITNSILQIQASITEKESRINNASSSYNVSSAKAQMESAEAAISTYRNQKLAEYKKMLSDYKIKLQELQFTASSMQDKTSLLAKLESSHKNAVDQKYYQTITQIDSSIQTLNTELISARLNLRMHQIAQRMYLSNVDDEGVPVSISLATMEMISSLLTQQESLTSQLNELNVQIQQTEERISQGSIIAEQGGTVSVISTLVKGDSIAAGTPVATIIPPSESEFKVQLYVSNSDIANIAVGDDVKYNLPALPSNQYGMANGKVTSISADTLVQDGQFSGYYLVECSIANTVLTDKDGNSGSVVIGMQTEAKIVTQKKIIIRYLLEKIDLF